MATFSKQKLSGSTDGKAIRLTATASPGTTIHATGTSASVIDEIWLYAYNSSADAQPLTIQFGGTATPNDDIKQIIPSQSGLTLVVPGLFLTGTGAAANTVAGYAAGSAVTISGYVNRIS
jgi:hypothetical protein